MMKTMQREEKMALNERLRAARERRECERARFMAEFDRVWVGPELSELRGAGCDARGLALQAAWMMTGK